MPDEQPVDDKVPNDEEVGAGFDLPQPSYPNLPGQMDSKFVDPQEAGRLRQDTNEYGSYARPLNQGTPQVNLNPH